ncbi:MAG: class I SAM-dependent methyltransferase [Candidatus Saccharimonadales bacterium]
MEKREKEYWWHLGRLDIIDAQLEKVKKSMNDKKLKILNIGCGTGGTVATLEKFGEVYNVDTESLAIKLLKKNGFKNGKVVQGNELPFKEGFFDAIVAMDVLEHIDAENEALTEWNRVLAADGQLLITVPAYAWLWSYHDIALHHFRRYNKSQLKVAVEGARFQIIKRSYMITFSLPLVVLFRILSNFSKKKGETSYVDLPQPVNGLFTLLLKVEAKFLKFAGLPFGTSVFVRARK